MTEEITKRTIELLLITLIFIQIIGLICILNQINNINNSKEIINNCYIKAKNLYKFQNYTCKLNNINNQLWCNCTGIKTETFLT